MLLWLLFLPVYLKPYPRAGFPNLDTMDILNWIILCCVGCLVHCRMFSSIPGFLSTGCPLWRVRQISFCHGKVSTHNFLMWLIYPLHPFVCLAHGKDSTTDNLWVSLIFITQGGCVFMSSLLSPGERVKLDSQNLFEQKRHGVLWHQELRGDHVVWQDRASGS